MPAGFYYIEQLIINISGTSYLYFLAAGRKAIHSGDLFKRIGEVCRTRFRIGLFVIIAMVISG
jgi:hypothetical protein